MESARVIAETDRLTIRLLTEPDISALASIWADAQVTRFMGGPRVFEEVCASFRRDLDVPPLQFDLWPVVERSSEVVLGHCGLLPKTVDGRDEVELVYVIAAAFWGRGYATEAAAAIRDYGFRTLGVARLVSLIDPAHAASAQVALKVGMKLERDTVRPSGKTMRVYAIAA
jgi:[ribosomal protein S5]-alanine N-acetyltransferase